MILDSYHFPEQPAEVDSDLMRLHVIEVDPRDYVELVINDRRYLITNKNEAYKIGDLIHLKPVDEQSLKPSLFHALKRFFKGNSEAFRIYSVSNLFVITCEDHFIDSDYQVLGLRSLRE